MAEPLRTEVVKAKVFYSDRAHSPFVAPNPSHTDLSLGEFDDPYAIKRQRFLHSIIDHVKPPAAVFEKISTAHGRNMTEMATSKKVVWAGNLPGDIYGARTFKGTSSDSVKLERDDSADPRGHGLMEDSQLSRPIKASEYMRAHGLPTERLAVIRELEEVYVLNKSTQIWEKMPIKKWEEKELERIKVEDPGFYIDAKNFLKETKFIVVERDMQVDERVEDLIIAFKANEMKKIIEPLFSWINAATYARNGGLISDTPKPDKFEYSIDDLNRFFRIFIPSQMGIYLGRFHRIGLVHKYLHPSNWSAVATIVDTESIKGRPLFSDDTIPNENALSGDIWETMHTISDLVESLQSTDEFKSVDVESLEVQACYNFFKNYLTERFGEITTEGVKILEEMNTRLDSTPKVLEMLKADLNSNQREFHR